MLIVLVVLLLLRVIKLIVNGLLFVVEILSGLLMMLIKF